MAKLKITYAKSAIGFSKDQKATIALAGAAEAAQLGSSPG